MTTSVPKQLASLFQPLVKSAPSPASPAMEKRFADLRSRVIDSRLGAILDSLWTRLRTATDRRPPPDRLESQETVAFLVQRGMAVVASIEFQLAASAFPADSGQEVITLAPSAASIDAWIKVMKVNEKAFTDFLLANGTAVYPTAGLEWLLEAVPPARLAVVIDLLFGSTERPQHLDAPGHLLQRRLESDSKGLWLESLLGAAAAGSDRLNRLVELLKGSQKAEEQALRHLPILVEAKGISGSASDLVRRVFDDLPQAVGGNRIRGCAQLAKFTADLLLLPNPSPAARELLGSLQSRTRTLRTTASNSATQRDTWVFECLGDEIPDSGGALGVNSTGARHVITGLLNLRKGINPTLVLEALARNVGLQAIGEPGGRVAFDPKIHEDTVGGVMPGEMVQVIRCGWRFEREMVQRVAVGTVGGSAHV